MSVFLEALCLWCGFAGGEVFQHLCFCKCHLSPSFLKDFWGRHRMLLWPATLPLPSQSFKLLLHHLLTCTVSDEKSDIIFQYIACSSFGDFCSFNGFEQFNYVTRCGFLSVSRARSLCSFGSLDWWVYNFYHDGKVFCHCFFKIVSSPPVFSGNPLLIY